MQFQQHNFEGIGSLISLPSSQRKGQRVFFASNVARFFGYQNTTQSLRTANCIRFNGANQQECDYTVVKKSEAKEFFEMLINIKEKEDTILSIASSGQLISKFSKDITLLSESGVWKLALASRLEGGVKLRHWLAKEVLPSISATGTYTMKPSNPFSNSLQLTEINRLKAQAEQIQESKDVNNFQMEKRSCKFDIINHNKNNHQLVHGRTAKELKELYPELKNKSDKEILREKEPALSVALAYNDFMVQQGADLNKLDKISQAVVNLSNAFLEFGLTVDQIF